MNTENSLNQIETQNLNLNFHSVNHQDFLAKQINELASVSLNMIVISPIKLITLRHIHKAHDPFAKNKPAYKEIFKYSGFLGFFKQLPFQALFYFPSRFLYKTGIQVLRENTSLSYSVCSQISSLIKSILMYPVNYMINLFGSTYNSLADDYNDVNEQPDQIYRGLIPYIIHGVTFRFIYFQGLKMLHRLMPQRMQENRSGLFNYLVGLGLISIANLASYPFLNNHYKTLFGFYSVPQLGRNESMIGEGDHLKTISKMYKGFGWHMASEVSQLSLQITYDELLAPSVNQLVRKSLNSYYS